MSSKNKVFLGGTCAGGMVWRNVIIPKLTVPYFNPVVEDWTPECQAIEELEKEECSIHLYVITSAMEGVYSIAEVIDSAHDKSKVTVLQVVLDGFTEHQLTSLRAVVSMVGRIGGIGYMGVVLSDVLRRLITSMVFRRDNGLPTNRFT